jgi:hypothetical protein
LLGTDFNVSSLISLPMDMSEVIINSVARQKENGVRTSAAHEIRLDIIYCYCFEIWVWVRRGAIQYA